MKRIVFVFVCLALGVVVAFSSPSAIECAMVSGSVVIPDSDMGYKPDIYGMKVRVEGTVISADIVAVNRYQGDFDLTNVPPGTNTLMLIEDNQDVFTQSSKRVQVNVTGDSVTGVSFDLVYHWKELSGYPAPMGTTGYVNEWTPHFISDQIGFILFRVRGTGIDPERVELYRTLNGGVTWTEIGGDWVKGVSPYPDFLHLSYYFVDENHGVIQALVDTNADPDVEWYNERGVLWTSNGGDSWQYTAFPTPPDTYDINILRFAQISSSHLIAAGTTAWESVNSDAIWESPDAGATWDLVAFWKPATGCSALGANPQGKAIAFFTPYWAGGGVGRSVAYRDTSGNWTKQDDNRIATNSGYGPADLPMLGETVWVSNAGPGQLASLDAGLYRSDDAGLNWTIISTAPHLQYMDFASQDKGFALAGGPAYVTYDGGETWLYQSSGGGLCCHGNHIWAFDATHAIWHDEGVGDPDSGASLFTYVEPWETNFEVLPGVQIKDGYVEGGENEVPVASYQILNHGPVPIRVDALTIHTFSPCTYSNDISQVKLWLDQNANGYADEADTLLAQGVFSADQGALPLSLSQGLELKQRASVYVLVTYDFAGDLYPLRTFVCSLTAQNMTAVRTDTDAPVFPTGPPNYPLTGRRITTGQVILSDDFENGLDQWNITSDDLPDPGYGWQIVETNSVSPTHSAFVVEDRNNPNWITNHYLTLVQALDLSQEGNYFLAFSHRYLLQQSFKVWVEASSDGGTTWDAIGRYGSHDTWAVYSTGDFVYEVLDLSSYAGESLLIRFRFDSTAGSYNYGEWYLDDIKVFYNQTPSAVALLSPSGGELIPSDSTYVIEWVAPSQAETFKLMHSTDNGTTWKVIEEGLTSTSYCWQVPRTGKNKKGCLVKVIGYDASGKKVSADASGSPFTIEVVGIVYPNGGEILHAGESKTVEWRASSETDHFDLSFSFDEGTTWTPIQNGTGVGGTSLPFEVPVPSAGNKRKCLMKITAFNASGVKVGVDTSDSPFTVEVVKLTSPNGGPPPLKSGLPYSITWTIYDTAKPITKVQLLYTIDGGTTWNSIKDPPPGPFDPGQYSFPWTPRVGKQKNKCKVKVILKDEKGVTRGSDTSDAYFTIEP